MGTMSQVPVAFLQIENGHTDEAQKILTLRCRKSAPSSRPGPQTRARSKRRQHYADLQAPPMVSFDEIMFAGDHRGPSGTQGAEAGAS